MPSVNPDNKRASGAHRNNRDASARPLNPNAGRKKGASTDAISPEKRREDNLKSDNEQDLWDMPNGESEVGKFAEGGVFGSSENLKTDVRPTRFPNLL